MTEKKQLAWDPLDKSVLTDQIAAYDRMRKQCPVAHSDYLHWSLFKHAEIMRVLTDTRTFSNAVSHPHVAIPNGMDPPKHTEYRRIIDRYFIAERMKEFEPTCRTIVERLIRLLVNQQEVDWVTDFADIFAVQVQCAFLDWPASLHEPLLAWTRKNQAATLSGNVAAMDAVAVEFDGYIRERLNESRNLTGTRGDPVARLLQERVFDRQLTDEEIVSILRNWTVGELSTISACISILMHYLALHPFLQEQLRNKAELLPAAIEEILRIHPPLIASRRITTSAVNLGGCAISQSERITVMWASANRDDAVFGDPDEFRLDRDTSQNLLYGAGIHYCPGAPLARLELRIAIEELLRRTGSLKLSARGNPVRATYPASGFSSLQLSIDWNARPKYPRAE